MDECITKAEKLIELTNTALARMKYDTSCDDLTYIEGVGKNSERSKTKRLGFEFEGEINKYLTGNRERIFDIDNFSWDRKNLDRDNRIEELNNKIEAYRQQLLIREERESLRALQLDRNELITSRSVEHLIPPARTPSDTNISQKSMKKPKSVNLAEELKSKLLQTQEVVDRGIQTARSLSETVDVLKTKPLRTGIYDDEVSLSKSRSSEKLGKSESRSTIKTARTKRCKKCNAEITRRSRSKEKARKPEENVLLTRVTGRDSYTRKPKRLNLQQLPSLNIQGDLSCQKIPSVDIPPGKRECLPVRAKTAFETYSHEQLLRDRVDRIIDDVKKSNSFIPPDNVKKAKCVECSNCGKVIKVRDSIADSSEIDKLLKICDYNVFDPRIDEFVERCNVKLDEEAKYTQTEEEPGGEREVRPVDVPQVLPKEIEMSETPILERKVKIKDLTSELTKRYRQEATELENEHLQLENIITDLFEKMDESQAFFKKSDLLSTKGKEEKRKPCLSVTPPVLLSYTGSGEEADDGNNTVLRPNRTQKNKMSSKAIRKKLEKKELEANCKLLSSSHPRKERSKTEAKDGIVAEIKTKPRDAFARFLKPVRDIDEDGNNRTLSKEVTSHGTVEPMEPTLEPNINKKPLVSSPEPPKSSPPPALVNLTVVEEASKHATTASDYESDFEEESPEEPAVVSELPVTENTHKCNTRLSTISEVDSEVDRKLSDLSITPEDERENNVNREIVEPLKSKTDSHSASSEEDDTRRLLKRVNKDLREVASQHLAQSKEESLTKDPIKEVLDALKNQFERTELLADKLTESIKEVNMKNTEEAEVLLPRDNLTLVDNLQRTRKTTNDFSQRRNILPPFHLVNSMDKSESSSRKIQKEKNEKMEIKSASPTGSGSSSPGKSYSEGEISEQELICTERSSPSIGEVIEENNSDESDSVIKLQSPY